MTANRNLSVLRVGGHPKDTVLYAGWTLAFHVERGDTVAALTPTHGISHHEKAVAAHRRGERIDIHAVKCELIRELERACAEEETLLSMTQMLLDDFAPQERQV